MPRVKELGELGLIRRLRESGGPLGTGIRTGIGDDTAVLDVARDAVLLATTDLIVEDVHFRRATATFHDIGWKALAVNLSDIAAMGGTPRLALLSLGLPVSLAPADLQGILDGFLALAVDAGVTLAGGNITRSPGPLIVDVTVTGFVRPRSVLTRGGGRPGDDIYVTGEVGAAAAGLSWWKYAEIAKDAEGAESMEGISACVERHRRPQPRVRIGALLGRNRAASACMDLSDGLADAVRQVAEASGTGALVDAASIPIPAAARAWFDRAGQDAVTAAIAGGDDYELLFTVPRRARGRLATVIRQARGVRVTRIGELTRERTLAVVRHGRPEPLPSGFVHF